jgi:L-ribulose-5-phosphate 3-epimerase
MTQSKTPSRRALLRNAVALAARVPDGVRALRVGIMDVIFGFSSDPEAFAAAQRVGFDAIQVTLGKPRAEGRLLLADPALQRRILASSSQHNVAIASTYLDILHRDCLQSSEAAKTWIRQAIQITSKLRASIVELAFFFKCGLNNARDIDAVVDALRELAPEAQAAKVLLGFENTLSAEDNARILDRVGSPAVKVWYDIGNSTNMGHFDVPREIRFLGKDRIGQIHIKDKVYLGQGAVDVKGCLEAIFDIGYTGFCVLETAAPTGDRVADAAKNLQLLRAIEKQIRRRSP